MKNYFSAPLRLAVNSFFNTECAEDNTKDPELRALVFKRKKTLVSSETSVNTSGTSVFKI